MHWSLLDRKGSFAFIYYFSNVLFICSVLFTGARASWELQRSPTTGLRLILGYFLTGGNGPCRASKRPVLFFLGGQQNWDRELDSRVLGWDANQVRLMRRLPSRPWTISPWLSFKMAVVKCEGIALLFQEKSEIFLTGRERGKGEEEKEKEEKERERWAPSTIISAFLFHFIFWSQNHGH